MKILVTGGTGFLGRHVVWWLAAENHRVVFTGRSRSAAEEVAGRSPGRAEYRMLEHGKAGAGEVLHDAARGADAVVHCAALSAPWGRRRDFWEANVESTREVLDCVRRCRISRLVHISTPSTYFGFSDARQIDEDAPLPDAANEYVRTKRIAEELIEESGAESVILRPRALFGPWDTTLAPRLLRVMRSGRGLPLPRRGRALADVTCVENAADAVLRAVTQPLPRRVNVYNVSNGEPVPIEELLARIADACGIPFRVRYVPYALLHAASACFEGAARVLGGWEPPLTRYGAGTLNYDQTLSISRIRSELGYAPPLSLEEGIRRYGAWWRSAENPQRLS